MLKQKFIFTISGIILFSITVFLTYTNSFPFNIFEKQYNPRPTIQQAQPTLAFVMDNRFDPTIYAQQPTPSITAADMIIALNSYRRANNIKPLIPDEGLSRYASKRTEDHFKILREATAETDLLDDHAGFYADGESKEILNYAPEFTDFGENLSFGLCKNGEVIQVKTAKDTIEKCLAKSKDHNERMLDESYTHVGVAAKHPFYIQIFAKKE